MSRIKSLITAALATAFCASAAHASFTFTTIGQTYNVDYSAVYAGANLSATVAYQLTGLSGNQATFSIVAANNTLVSQIGTNRVTAFGVGVITPTLSSVTDNSGTWDTAINTTFPGFQQVAFCAFVGPNCSGGGGGGLAEGGGSTSFSTILTFAQPTVTSITFAEPFVIKFQAAGSTGSSVEFSGCLRGDTTCTSGPPQETPEPGTLALAGLALFGAAALKRRRS